MSARRIQKLRNCDPKMTRIQHNRSDAVTRKREERAVREQYKRERKIESYLADDENFPSFSAQLGKLGLQLRDIPGDGNCLFRALGDQMEGHGRNHFKYRFDVVTYMSDNRADFEPFVEDDVPFDKHLSNLCKLGTYAGNDAIVAFARLHYVNVVIHQLNAPFLLIQGNQSSTGQIKQIHIAYHNGDHYSSVRRVHDNTESPASIKIKIGEESESKSKVMNGHVTGGVVSAVRDEQSIEEEVMLATSCMDIEQIREVLVDCGYDVELAIATLLQIMEVSENGHEETASLASQMTSTDSGVWSEASRSSGDYASPQTGATHVRENSYGGSSGYGSLSSFPGGARPKQTQIKPQSAKEKRENKKLEKKKRAEERHKMRIQGNSPQVPTMYDDNAVTVVSKDIGMMKI
ncbi:OTU domain-containing protein 3-like [Saccostrea echinata]|uniref:OTU domain-containing protein 3-like n=1 Tax=Saccostrea echinata TaxID=191078 RepID=UPI002A819C69|nr:OTU domain-containing protein 3-like [Saccostrea echinata]